jgi:hypothetical protein
VFQVKENLLKKGVLPVYFQKKTCVFLATTPGERTSYFMRIILAVDENGNPRMPLLRMGQPCSKCVRKKTPWACKSRSLMYHKIEMVKTIANTVF